MNATPILRRRWKPHVPGPRLGDSRFDGLHAGGVARRVGYSANTLARRPRALSRGLRRRRSDRWQALRDELDCASTDATDGVDRRSAAGRRDRRPRPPRPPRPAPTMPASGPSRPRSRPLGGELGDPPGASWPSSSSRSAPSRGRGSSSSVATRSLGRRAGRRRRRPDVQMRIVEAQEAERLRLAQEIHDGPAQALSNAIFQVEYIERVVETDLPLARTELRYLRDLLRRELGDVRVVHQPAATAGPRRARPRRRDPGHRRSHPVHHRRDRSRPISTAPDDALDGCRTDGGPARGAGSPAECPEARPGQDRVRRRHGRTTAGGSWKSATTAGDSMSETRRPVAGATSAFNSCASERS